ncbi:NAD-dependent epimerase/dehydratase family protein [Haloferacaceae archaeon DSL9]
MARLLVTGGSGFIGREVCRLAVADGHDVRSVSRSGRPDGAAPWIDGVEWTSADVFSPHTWRDQLRGCDGVVHSIGIAHERPADGVTFERLNGDAAIITALEAERVGVETFVFLSSAANYPTARREYIRSKRRAERAVDDLELETVTLRPGPVYGPDQPHFPGAVNALFRLADSIPGLADRLGDARPLPVRDVARAAYRAALEPRGRLLTVDEIVRI